MEVLGFLNSKMDVRAKRQLEIWMEMAPSKPEPQGKAQQSQPTSVLSAANAAQRGKCCCCLEGRSPEGYGRQWAENVENHPEVAAHTSCLQSITPHFIAGEMGCTAKESQEQVLASITQILRNPWFLRLDSPRSRCLHLASSVDPIPGLQFFIVIVSDHQKVDREEEWKQGKIRKEIHWIPLFTMWSWLQCVEDRSIAGIPKLEHGDSHQTESLLDVLVGGFWGVPHTAPPYLQEAGGPTGGYGVGGQPLGGRGQWVGEETGPVGGPHAWWVPPTALGTSLVLLVLLAQPFQSSEWMPVSSHTPPGTQTNTAALLNVCTSYSEYV
ncbi:putative uncharacterized protein encoded by LINC01599 [Gorilla gorilla gorilla]|uniref:Uncharacterized protein n=1 Tax=Gorilla gorilla gorilla TaxID=9595 RepID=G3RHH3_GORGO|nr:putative uncharacterized protein encoded by LINC01599 [Gorilla gorilla gorilla]